MRNGASFSGMDLALNRCYNRYMAAGWEDGKRWEEAFIRIRQYWHEQQQSASRASLLPQEVSAFIPRRAAVPPRIDPYRERVARRHGGGHRIHARVEDVRFALAVAIIIAAYVIASSVDYASGL